MEPRQEAVPGRGELPSILPSEAEVGGVGHETKSGAAIEHQPARQNSVSDAQAAVQAIPSLPTPVVDSAVVDDGLSAQDDNTPIVANDDDLIEKEWVDKAKQIIAATKDDPYRREQEVSKLQIEYIRRRYGREIGESGD